MRPEARELLIHRCLESTREPLLKGVEWCTVNVVAREQPNFIKPAGAEIAVEVELGDTACDGETHSPCLIGRMIRGGRGARGRPSLMACSRRKSEFRNRR